MSTRSTTYSPNGPERRWLAVPSDRPACRVSVRKLILSAALVVGLLASLSSVALASTSIVDRLSTDKAAVEVVSVPTGTKLIKVALMKTLSGSALIYKMISVTQRRYVPPAGYPVVDLQAATSTGSPIGGWAGRRLTMPLETRLQREARELKERVARETAERETREKAEREAREKAEREARERVVREAREKVEHEARELAEREVKERTEREAREAVEREVRDRLEREAAAKLEREAKEKVEQEARAREAREAAERAERELGKSSMRVGLDTGGWSWPSAVKDIAGAVRYIRSSYGNYNSDAQMQLLANYGVTLMPLFSNGSTIGSISRATYVSTVVTWFKRYGHGGTFWAGKTDLGATTAEILNEPGNPYFWSDPSNYSGYAALARGAHEGLEALPSANRPALLLSYDGGYGGVSYGRALVKAEPAIVNVAGGWTVHPYGGHGASSALGNRARVTETYADTHKPVYVTEVGWPTALGKEATGDSLQWSESQQAAQIKEFTLWARSLGYVRAVIDFNYADYGANNWYGIVDTSGTKHKLAYGTLKGLAEES
jgi:hypothetical protein